jgi:hypothetical protein
MTGRATVSRQRIGTSNAFTSFPVVPLSNTPRGDNPSLLVMVSAVLFLSFNTPHHHHNITSTTPHSSLNTQQ